MQARALEHGACGQRHEGQYDAADAEQVHGSVRPVRVPGAQPRPQPHQRLAMQLADA
jgi:hypothetical protein